MKLVCDIEADGLYEEATEIHCAVFKDADTGRVWKFRKRDSIVAMLEKCDYLIMHHGIGYDSPLIKKLFNYEYKGKIFDTVLMSRELCKNISVPDKMKEDYKEAGKKLDGPHSLAAWGYRLGRGKVEHEDWSVFSPEMMHRCAEDVEITHLLYNYLVDKKLDKTVFPARSIWLTMEFMSYISRQEKHGWRLDVKRCERGVQRLEKWVRWIDAAIDKFVPVLPLEKEDRVDEDGYSEGFQNPYTKAGKFNANLQKWIDKSGIDWEEGVVGGAFCRINFRKVNLNSNDELKSWLLDMGWQPEEYNYSKKEKDSDGNPLRLSPKLSADDSFIGVDGKVGRILCRRVQCNHRRSNIEGWINRVRPDGRLESRISGFADTYRVRHANIANVPNGESFFGAYMRSCFIADKDKVLVSADASACQDRMIISRARDNGINDPEFEHMVLYGTKEDRTKSHCRVQDEVNAIFKEKDIPLIPYGTAKNFGFAYKFGGQPKKLGYMSGEKNEKKAIEIGTIVKGAFDKIFNAQVQVQKHLLEEWLKTAKSRTVSYVWRGQKKTREEMYNGRLKTLDGRQVLIRNKKDLLVYGVQADEAILMQHATVLANRRLDAKYTDGVDFKQVCMYHDEITFEVTPAIAEDVKTILEESISDSSKYFNLAIPQVGEGEIGNNWLEIH